jgi:protein-L-isoaspartate(D-aspartate) O-methyltransferase
MDFKTARRRMVDSQVRTNDVTDLRLQTALETIPREVFLPAALREQAYVERELPLAPGRSLMTMRDFAKLAAAAKPRAGELCLCVAAGAGYATAILAQLVEMVVAVETEEALAMSAQDNLTQLGVSNAAVLTSDHAKGAASQGPFDLIFVNGAIEVAPDALLAQLKDGGRMAAIMRRDGVSRGVIYSRSGDAFSCAVKFDASAKTVLPGFAAEKSFVF